MSGPSAGSTLLDLLEHRWRRHLAAGEPAGTLDVEPEMLDAAALALGDLSRSEPPTVLNRRWPACLVVAVAQVTARYDKNGKVWPAWFRATRTRAASRSAADWADAFLGSLATLGVPAPAGDPLETVLAHAAVPESSLPGFLRLAGTGVPERELSAIEPAVAWSCSAVAATSVTAAVCSLVAVDASAEELSISLAASIRAPSRSRPISRAKKGLPPARSYSRESARRDSRSPSRLRRSWSIVPG